MDIIIYGQIKSKKVVNNRKIVLCGEGKIKCAAKCVSMCGGFAALLILRRMAKRIYRKMG
jgi:hypothetical protein